MKPEKYSRKLEAAGYIKVEKVFIDRKPRTFCKITGKGRRAVRNLIKKLENLANIDESMTEKTKKAPNRS